MVLFKVKPSDESKRAFCRVHDVSPRTLDGWLDKFEEMTFTTDKRKFNKRPKQIQHDLFVSAVDCELRINGLTSICRLRQKLYERFPYSLSTYYEKERESPLL